MNYIKAAVRSFAVAMLVCVIGSLAHAASSHSEVDGSTNPIPVPLLVTNRTTSTFQGIVAVNPGGQRGFVVAPFVPFNSFIQVMANQGPYTLSGSAYDVSGSTVPVPISCTGQMATVNNQTHLYMTIRVERGSLGCVIYPY